MFNSQKFSDKVMRVSQIKILKIKGENDVTILTFEAIRKI